MVRFSEEKWRYTEEGIYAFSLLQFESFSTKQKFTQDRQFLF